MIAEELTLKIHTAPDGIVWYSDGTRSPCSSRMPSHNFVTGPLFTRPRSIRLLGTEGNVDLLVGLYQQLGQSVARFEVASPLLCSTRRELQNPQIALFRMRQCSLPPALGGWHTMTAGDYVTYALAKRLRENAGDLDATGLELLRRHPAWSSLCFLQDLHPYFVAHVVAAIRDPRWYVASDTPYRTNKLRRFMGLDVQQQAQVSSSTSLVIDAQARRNFCVLAAWQHREPPSAAEMQIPGHFLWRIWHAAGRGARGDLRASQMFLSFLNYTWLQGLNRQQVDVFDPTRIFKTDDELTAYKSHLAEFATTV